MLKDIVKTYYEMGYNCSEAFIHAGNEYYDLGLHDHDMRMMAAFGGGIQCGDVCGALLGGAAVISAKYIEIKAHDQPQELRKLTTQFVKRFQVTMGSRLCAQVKPIFFDKNERCLRTVMTSAEVLEDVINEWEEERA